MEEQENNDNKTKIEIVKGDPKDLDISEVKDNLAFEIEDKDPKKEKIIIPEDKNSQ